MKFIKAPRAGSAEEAKAKSFGLHPVTARQQKVARERARQQLLEAPRLLNMPRRS
jgi:hypothetical protein